MIKPPSARRLKALFVKEFYQILRDPSTLLISVVLPLMLLFLYAYGVSLDLDHLRIGVVLEDSGEDAQSLLDSFRFSRYFDVKVVRDRRELLHNIEEGSIRGFVVIPSYFTDFRKRKAIAPIQAIADGSETNTANFFQYYVEGAISSWLAVEDKSGDWKNRVLINASNRVWYNEQVESRLFILPGAIAIVMTLIGTLLTALVISREWERGTMEALLSTPVKPIEMILGKVVPYFFLGLLSMTISALISVWLFGIPFRGSIWALALSSSVFLFSALGLGLLISTLSRSQALSYQIALFSGFLPAFILSGFLFEIFSMPKWIQVVTYFIPARYFVQSLQTLFLVGNVWPLLLRDLIPMALIGGLFFLLILRKTVKQLE